jgi:sugar transferase (PEP-CTERM/EpsH1 system associated)
MRVLYLTHRLPYAPNRGDRIRAYHTLRCLRDVATVDLVSLVHDADEAAHASGLSDLADSVHVAMVPKLRNRLLGASRLASKRPLTHSLLDAPGMHRALLNIFRERRPDVVLAYCSGMAKFALEPPLNLVPIVIDMVDVDSLKWQSLAATSRFGRRWIYQREQTCLSAFEGRAARQAFATVVINDRERTALEQIAPGARIEVIPSGIDYAHFQRPDMPAVDTADVVFCGVMNYLPNEEAAVWLAERVWPLVKAALPHARLTLVGSNPTDRVKRLGSDPTIHVTGQVPDVRTYLWRAAVGVAPLQIARGIQNKVLEALAAGLPTVVTPVVADGLPTHALRGCRIAATPDLFAGAIVGTLTLPAATRSALAASADLQSLTWSARLKPLGDLLREAASVATAP